MIRFLVAAAALIVYSTGAAAQELTVDQLVDIALERAPEIQAARTEIAGAGGQRLQAGLRPNPSLMGSNRQQFGGTDRETMIRVDWPLDLFRRPARMASADLLVEATRLSVGDRVRIIALAVREQAGRLLAARRAREIANEGAATARRLRDLLEQRVIEGESPKLDSNVAVVEALRAEAAAAAAAGDVDAAAIELKGVVGLPADAPLTLRDSLESLVRGSGSPVGDAPASTAIARRSDVMEARARVALAEARVEEARRAGRADLALTAAYTNMTFSFPQRGMDAAGRIVPIRDLFQSVTIGASVLLPFTNRNQGAVAAAEAEHAGAQAVLAARERRALAELEAAAVRDREARRAAELYAFSIRDLARQNVDAFLEAYDLGRYTLADVLAEQRRYLDVEASYTAVLLRAYQARVDLMRARGERQ